jgi:hypothetical protein
VFATSSPTRSRITSLITLREPHDRHAYYDWLYGGELAYNAADHRIFHHINDGRFLDRTAVEVPSTSVLSYVKRTTRSKRFSFTAWSTFRLLTSESPCAPPFFLAPLVARNNIGANRKSYF